MTPHFLGIDVGGTATRYVVIDDGGGEVLRGEALGATGHLFTSAERARFTAMVGRVAASVPPVSAIHAGITGLGEGAAPDAKSILATACEIAADTITCSDDIELAFRAAFQPGEGHLIAAGTGSIGLHLTADGKAIRVGGRGLLIDDGGSGTWIALTAIDRLYRRIDGGGEPGDANEFATRLYGAVGGDAWDDVRSFIYGRDRGTIGELARVVAAAANAGDPLATAVLTDAVSELARLALALIGRVGQLPVAFVGRVVGLHPSIGLGLRRLLPDSPVSFPEIDAAMHAAQMARKNALRSFAQ